MHENYWFFVPEPCYSPYIRKMIKTFATLSAVFILNSCSSNSEFTQSHDPEISAVLKLAGNGNTEAQHRLCYGYSYGYEGLQQDDNKAYRWCAIAAQSGEPSSVTLYAEKFYLGVGTDINYRQAFSLYKKAAEKGHVHAQYILSKLYIGGLGTEVNREQGIYWLLRSADQGYKPALDILQNIQDSDVIKI